MSDAPPPETATPPACVRCGAADHGNHRGGKCPRCRAETSNTYEVGPPLAPPASLATPPAKQKHHYWCAYLLPIREGGIAQPCDCWLDESEPEPRPSSGPASLGAATPPDPMVCDCGHGTMQAHEGRHSPSSGEAEAQEGPLCELCHQHRERPNVTYDGKLVCDGCLSGSTRVTTGVGVFLSLERYNALLAAKEAGQSPPEDPEEWTGDMVCEARYYLIVRDMRDAGNAIGVQYVEEYVALLRSQLTLARQRADAAEQKAETLARANQNSAPGYGLGDGEV